MPAGSFADPDFTERMTKMMSNFKGQYVSLPDNAYTMNCMVGIGVAMFNRDLAKMAIDRNADIAKLAVDHFVQDAEGYNSVRAAYVPSNPPRYLRDRGRWMRADDPGSPEDYRKKTSAWDTSRVR